MVWGLGGCELKVFTPSGGSGVPGGGRKTHAQECMGVKVLTLVSHHQRWWACGVMWGGSGVSGLGSEWV